MKKFFTRLSLVLALFAGVSTMQAQEALVVDGSKGYDFIDGNGLTQGKDYRLPGTDGTWYAMPDFFTHKEGDVWTFQAYSYPDYAYFIKLNEQQKYIEVTHKIDGSDPESLNADWDDSGTTHCLWLGGTGFGFPSATVAGQNWGGSPIAVAQVAKDVFRVRYVFGEEMSTGTVNFKFFTNDNYGHDTEMINWIDIIPNDYIWMNGKDNDATSDTGNFMLKPDATVAEGDTLIVTIDFDGKFPGQATVEYREKIFDSYPTFNGVDLVRKAGGFVYEGELKQGDEFTLANLEVVGADVNSLYIDEFFATPIGSGKYKFNAVSGAYTVQLFPELNYVKIFPGTADAPATFESDKAIWLIGNDQVGQPNYAVNNSNWGGNLATSFPIAQVSPNVYKITLTVGKELGSSVNFKFFPQAGWGGEFRCQDLDMAENDYLQLIQGERVVTSTWDDNGNEVWSVDWGADNGNIKNGGVSLENGDKLILTIDLNGYVPATYADENADEPYAELTSGVKGKISVEYEAYAGPKPTINGQAMKGSDNGYSYVGEFKNGETYTIGGDVEDVVNLVKSDDFFYNFDYFTKVGDASFKFNAVSGYYALELDQDKKYFRIYPVQADGSAGIFTADGGWATWVCGNNGIGFPSYTTNMNNWGESNGWSQALNISISPAQIAEKIYRLTVTVGKQVTADAVFKFYDSYNYTIQDGRESDAAPDFIDLLDENIVYSGNDLAFNGLEDGATYVVIIDRTGERSTIKAEKATDETGAGVELPTSVKGVEVQAEKGDNAIYTLSGVRVAAPQKGVYIQNGKKFVVK